MKAEELMIGDWVTVKGVPTKIHDIDEMDGINREWIAGCEDGGCICCKDVQPIPLTPKILEKNGFYRREIPTRDEIGHYYHRTTDPCSIFVRMSFGDGRDFGNEIRYVHDLQHLLKLCGIDKEIVV